MIRALLVETDPAARARVLWASVALALAALVAVAWFVVRARRRLRRRAARAVAASLTLVVDEPRRPSGVVAQDIRSPSEANTAAPKTIIVTGCDSAHYDLVVDLLTSLTDAGRDGLAVGFVHVGDDALPPEIEAAVDCVAHVAADAVHGADLRGFRLAHLTIKPRLPEFFPGYEVYVWLDGDTWVQNRVGLDQIIQCAQLADMCAHPELDPNYFREPIPSNRLTGLYGALYGEDEAARHIRLPMFNAGVFAARAGSPLWALWRQALAEVSRPMAQAPGLYFSDQVPLHRLIATDRLSVHPLRAVNNWLVHAGAPSLNLARKRVMTPTFPHEDINVVHLTWITKDAKYRIDHGGREISFRYRSIKALFDEGRPGQGG
jgi:hypothetical protein